MYLKCDDLQTTDLQLLYRLRNVCNVVFCFKFNCHSLGSDFVFSEIRCQLAVLCKLHVISVVGISMEAEKKCRDNRSAGISSRV